MIDTVILCIDSDNNNVTAVDSKFNRSLSLFDDISKMVIR